MNRIRNKNKRQEKREHIINQQQKTKRKMKHLMKGIRIAAYIAEIIVAGSTIVELVENELIRIENDPSLKHLLGEEDN